MENQEISDKCSAFLQSLGKPGFIVFGWEKDDGKYGFVYSNHQTPPNVAMKGMLWAANDLAQKQL